MAFAAQPANPANLSSVPHLNANLRPGPAPATAKVKARSKALLPFIDLSGPDLDPDFDFDNIRLPLLPPGPYLSSDAASDGMSDDVEVLDEAPVHMRKKQILIDLLSESEEEGEAEEDEKTPKAGPSRGRKRRASSSPPPVKAGKGRGAGPANAYTLGSAVNGTAGAAGRPVKRGRKPSGGNVFGGAEQPVAGPSRAAAAPVPAPREPMMHIAFGDEDAMEVPLGWGGLGVPERNLPAAAPVLAPAAARPAPLDQPQVPAAAAPPVALPPAPAAAPPAALHLLPAAVQPRIDPLPQPAQPEPRLATDFIPVVLEVLPDICTDWALERISNTMAMGKIDNPAMTVIQMAFDVVGGYPKAKKGEAGSSKSKVVDKVAEEAFRSVEYKKDERRGAFYDDQSQNLLLELLPMIPMPHVKAAFRTTGSLLAPAYFALLAQSQNADKPYIPLKVGRNAKGKAKGLLNEPYTEDEGADPNNPFVAQRKRDGRTMYDMERKWLADHLRREAEESDAQKAREMARAEALGNGGGMECGCCFTDELMENMFQCSEGHLFCRDCTTQYCETKLGEHSHAITCMDVSGCTSLFPDSELTRLLATKSLLLYHRLKQAAELKLANIDGLEACPRCDYSAIIDNPHEKLFRCMAPDCGTVSCRKCRRVEHLPKTCEENEAELRADKRHTVEDAMSEALIRKCPKPTCGKPFVKDGAGCNKIICNQCQTVSCYVCRKIITNGYAHFDQNPADYHAPRVSGKCILWDYGRVAETAEVVAARAAAQERARAAAEADGVAIADADLHVPPPPEVPHPHRPHHQAHHHHHHHHHQHVLDPIAAQFNAQYQGAADGPQLEALYRAQVQRLREGAFLAAEDQRRQMLQLDAIQAAQLRELPEGIANPGYNPAEARRLMAIFRAERAARDAAAAGLPAPPGPAAPVPAPAPAAAAAPGGRGVRVAPAVEPQPYPQPGQPVQPLGAEGLRYAANLAAQWQAVPALGDRVEDWRRFGEQQLERYGAAVHPDAAARAALPRPPIEVPARAPVPAPRVPRIARVKAEKRAK